MLSGPERNPGQTGVAQTSRQIPLRTGDKTGNIQASDEFEYTERDLDKRWEFWSELGKYMENEVEEKLDNY